MKRFRMRLCCITYTLILSCFASTMAAGELHFCLHSEPKTLDPMLVQDESSETIRYLTGGVLIRFNRKTQALQPELAQSWTVSASGRKIAFKLREGISFSDGTPFSAEDVAFTMKTLMDPNLHSPTGDTFRTAEGSLRVDVLNPHTVAITFPAPIAGLERLFDQVAIVSSKSPQKNLATLGPYCVAEHKAGSFVLLRRNNNYWRHDSAGKQLPYIDSIRLDIQQNRDLELLRFRRGEVHLINTLDAESFGQLAAEMPAVAHDDGPSLDSEQIWFNQVSTAPIAPYKKAWFCSTGFRRAISEAINRGDLCRIVYSGHAHPAVGPVPPANHFWSNHSLQPHPYDVQSAVRRLNKEGFRLEGDTLRDREGHTVEFSVITNAGNKSRERMATLIQQDLAQIGIRLNVVTLDFPSLIERITRTFDYEACLLGLVNDDLDPNSQMNVWLSSASNHQWNPEQKAPATPWEAEIDRLMRTQGLTIDANQRKVLFDQVQQIAWEQEPFIYLLNKNSLSAISRKVKNSAPSALRPQTYWNIEQLSLTGDKN